MSYRIHEKIRHALESNPALTQKGLAERMGLNPAAVNRMLYGKRNVMAEEIPIIEDYLGVSLSHTKAEYTQKHEPTPVAAPADRIPVYRQAYGEIADWAPRHPAQAGITGAFAVYAFSDNMAPRYMRGELVYLHPGRPPQAGQDCLVLHKDGTMLLARMVRATDTALIFSQFHPEKEFQTGVSDVKGLYAVVGRG